MKSALPWALTLVGCLLGPAAAAQQSPPLRQPQATAGQAAAEGPGMATTRAAAGPPRLGLVVAAEAKDTSWIGALQRRLEGPPRKAPIVGPERLRERLRSASASIHRAAALKVERAHGHLFRLERALALSLSTAAIAELDRVAARLHQPALLARAHLAQGLALLLAPAEPSAARRAFSAALRIHPPLRADRDRFPPGAIRLLEQARQQVRQQAQSAPSARPSAAELSIVAGLAGLDQLLWLHSSTAGQRRTIIALIYDARAHQIHDTVQLTLVGSEGPQHLAAALAPLLTSRASGSQSPSHLPPGATAPSSARGPLPPRAARRPWYRSRWFWPVVIGVVVTAAATGLAVGLTRPAPKLRYALRLEL